MLFSPFDRVVAQLEHLLTFGKFFTIFSFLFGLSFAIQLRNATQKGVGFSGRFTWRLVVLALIALVHGAFFTGDILIIYAFLGLLLIPFRKLKTRTLLIIALVLVFNIPGLLLGIAQINAPPPTPEQLAANAEIQAQFTAGRAAAFEIKQSGSLAELVPINLTSRPALQDVFHGLHRPAVDHVRALLVRHVAGRLEIFRDTEANRRFFRRLLWPAAAVALVTTIVEIVHPSQFSDAIGRRPAGVVLVHRATSVAVGVLRGGGDLAVLAPALAGACCPRSRRSAGWGSRPISGRPRSACCCSMVWASGC